MNTLGVNRAAFGEFKCKKCGRLWYSAKAWRDFGQKCQRCDIEVNAHNLLPLGRYNCYKCRRSWKTKFDGNGCDCDKCGNRIYPKPEIEKNPFFKPNIIDREKAIIDMTKSHKMELCEKCQFYKKNCVTVSAKEMKIRPFVTKNTQIKGNINKYESNEFPSVSNRRSLDHSSSSSHNNITNNRVIPQNSRKYSLNTLRTESMETENKTRNALTYSSRHVNTPKVNTHQRREKSCCVIL